MAQGEHLVHTANREHIREERNGHVGEIVEKVLQNVIQYLKEHPANYQGQVVEPFPQKRTENRIKKLNKMQR